MPRLVELLRLVECHVSWNTTCRLVEIIISTEELCIEHAKYRMLPRVEK